MFSETLTKISHHPDRISTAVNSRDLPKMTRFVSSRWQYWSTWAIFIFRSFNYRFGVLL